MPRYLPNLLSALRLLAAPLAAYLILQSHDGAAFLVFAVASASDAADGFIARRWGVTSSFGALLDPAADKLLMLACFVALWSVGIGPLWLVVLVIGRDILLVVGAALVKFFSLPVCVKPIWLGKISTAVQATYLGILLLMLTFSFDSPQFVLAAAAATAFFTIASWLAYVQILLRGLAPGRRTA